MNRALAVFVIVLAGCRADDLVVGVMSMPAVTCESLRVTCGEVQLVDGGTLSCGGCLVDAGVVDAGATTSTDAGGCTQDVGLAIQSAAGSARTTAGLEIFITRGTLGAISVSARLPRAGQYNVHASVDADAGIVLGLLTATTINISEPGISADFGQRIDVSPRATPAALRYEISGEGCGTLVLQILPDFGEGGRDPVGEVEALSALISNQPNIGEVMVDAYGVTFWPIASDEGWALRAMSKLGVLTVQGSSGSGPLSLAGGVTLADGRSFPSYARHLGSPVMRLHEFSIQQPPHWAATVEPMSSGSAGVGPLALHQGALFWVENQADGGQTIQALPAALSDDTPVSVASGLRDLTALAATGDEVYWASNTDGVGRTPLDGGVSVTLSTASGVTRLLVDETRQQLYWLANSRVWSMRTEGGAPSSILPVAALDYDLAEAEGVVWLASPSGLVSSWQVDAGVRIPRPRYFGPPEPTSVRWNRVTHEVLISNADAGIVLVAKPR